MYISINTTNNNKSSALHAHNGVFKIFSRKHTIIKSGQ